MTKLTITLTVEYEEGIQESEVKKVRSEMTKGFLHYDILPLRELLRVDVNDIEEIWGHVSSVQVKSMTEK